MQATNIAWQSGSSLTCSVPRGQGIGLPVIVTTAGYRSGSSAPNFFSYVGGGLPLDPPVLYTSDRTVAVPTSITFRWLQSEPPDRIPPQSFTVCYWTVINDMRIICRVFTPSQLQVRFRCKYNTICPITLESSILYIIQVIVFSNSTTSLNNERRLGSDISEIPAGVRQYDKQYILHTSDLSTMPYL